MKNIRKKGDGSFRKLPNGSIEFAVDLGSDEYGKRQRKLFYGKTESECRKKYKEFIKGGERQPSKPKEHTLSTWLDEWLVTYKQHKVEASTYADYVQLASHVQNHAIGRIKLSQVKPLHVTEYFAGKMEYSHSFIKRSKFLINAAFECAADNDLCERNPVKRAEIASKPQAEKEAYTENEVKTILDFAKTDELFGLPVYIMLNSGIRSGEMRALTVSKFDFENGIIRIDTAIKENGELGLPKNNEVRDVPLEPEVLKFLAENLDRSVNYLIGDTRYVTEDGFRGRYDWFFKRLNSYLEEKGKNPIGFKPPHTTRRTFCTIHQRHGMPIAVLMKIVGHKTRVMTDLYTDVGDRATLTHAVKEHSLSRVLA
jgi:integrase